jgi:hypothetical protein
MSSYEGGVDSVKGLALGALSFDNLYAALNLFGSDGVNYLYIIELDITNALYTIKSVPDMPAQLWDHSFYGAIFEPSYTFYFLVYGFVTATDSNTYAADHAYMTDLMYSNGCGDAFTTSTIVNAADLSAEQTESNFLIPLGGDFFDQVITYFFGSIAGDMS